MNGEPIRKHYEGKWDNLIQKCTRCIQDWLRVASQRRRNYIIDQVSARAVKGSIKAKGSFKANDQLQLGHRRLPYFQKFLIFFGPDKKISLLSSHRGNKNSDNHIFALQNTHCTL